MPNQYQFVTYSAARQMLASRLADVGNNFWSDAECGLYLKWALRQWNALTEQWANDYAFVASAANGSAWYNTGLMVDSPRLRTVTDADLYTLMQYMLLEPPSGGGVWTGTGQFSLSDLQGALQRRRDEVIQMTGCNLAQYSLAATPNVSRVQMADTVLEPVRARWLPLGGSAATLTREDTLAFDYFDADRSPNTPASWSVVTGPPLIMEVDLAPAVPGSFDVLAIKSGATFNPPTPVLLGVPDGWAWVPVWGAMADLLSREIEANDQVRAEVCLKRYSDGLKAMQSANWLAAAKINGVPADTPSLKEQDAYLPEWETQVAAWPAVVQAGMDFVAPLPVGTATPLGVTLTLVGNAPLPSADGDYVQCSRDVLDAVLAQAQAWAMFKQGGAEVAESAKLEMQFMQAAVATNRRLMNLGIFTDTAHTQGQRQNRVEPRYAERG